MNFKHSKESENLQGFEKKFYDAIVELTTILCESTDIKKGEVFMTYGVDDEKRLTVRAVLESKEAGVTNDYLMNYGSVLSRHFPAFFTPAHYRAYTKVEPIFDEETNLVITGVYEGGV